MYMWQRRIQSGQLTHKTPWRALNRLHTKGFTQKAMQYSFSSQRRANMAPMILYESIKYSNTYMQIDNQLEYSSQS